MFHKHDWIVVSVIHVQPCQFNPVNFTVTGHNAVDKMNNFIRELAAGKTIIAQRCSTCNRFDHQTLPGIHQIQVDSPGPVPKS